VSDTDFGSAFSDEATASGARDEPLRITPEDIERAGSERSINSNLPPVQTIEMVSGQDLAREQYGILLPSPKRRQDLFVGLVRNTNARHTGAYSQTLVLSFDAEIMDSAGNPVDYVPVLVSGDTSKVTPPVDGTPVAVYGSRDHRDGVVRPEKVINLLNRAVIYDESGICFVATATYGTGNAIQVAELRRFRDQQLVRSRAGRWFIQAYYRHSPSLARWIAAGHRRTRIARLALDRLVSVLRWARDR